MLYIRYSLVPRTCLISHTNVYIVMALISLLLLPRDALQCKARSCYRLSSVCLSAPLLWAHAAAKGGTFHQNGWLDPDAVWDGEWDWSRGGCTRDGVVIIEGERAVFGSEFGASHCNQWDLCYVVVQKYVNRSSCRLRWWVESPRHSCIRWDPRASRERGRFWDRLPHWPNGFNGVYCNRNVFNS